MPKLAHFIVLFACFTVGIGAVYADFLGVYEPGETIRFGIECTNASGGADKGCTNPVVQILGPLDEDPINSSSMKEMSDALVPGLWRGNFTVGAGNQSGTWNIFVNITSSHVEQKGILHHFQVVGDNRGIDTAGRNINTTLDNTVLINSNVLDCPVRVAAQNVTITFRYNTTSYLLKNATYNYTGINVFVNETFEYTNETYLNKSIKKVHLG